mmetsp:Transcript_5887/g.11542  ORF Transcript_5887/g.11542 Transcript_5887/m.11542 type:complete len:272 (-) Transcript_5887:167-982(-)|eukprot:scaffold267_cov192-Amphora_coffeaeformis.AAC.8
MKYQTTLLFLLSLLVNNAMAWRGGYGGGDSSSDSSDTSASSDSSSDSSDSPSGLFVHASATTTTEVTTVAATEAAATVVASAIDMDASPDMPDATDKSETKWRDYATKKVLSGFARMALGCDGVERNVCYENEVSNIGELVTDATSIMLVEKYDDVYGHETPARRQMLRGHSGEEELEELDEERLLQMSFCDCKKYPTFCFWDAWCPKSGSGMYRKRRTLKEMEEITVTCQEDSLENLLDEWQLNLPILHAANDDCLAGLQCKVCWMEETA